MRFVQKTLRVASLFALLLACVACESRSLVQDLDQRQAHEIVSALYQSGIEARIVRGRGTGSNYAVEVSSSDYGPSVSLLQEKDLPSVAEPRFSELVAERSFLPKSRDFERLRIDHALSKQLEEALAAYPRVDKVHVIIRSSYPQDKSSPTVSVVLQTEQAGVVSVEEVKAFVEKAIPRAQLDRIFVKLVVRPQQVGSVQKKPEVVDFAAGIEIVAEDYSRLVTVILFLTIFVGVFGILLGYWFGYLHSSSKVVQETHVPAIAAAESLQIDEGPTQIREV